MLPHTKCRGQLFARIIIYLLIVFVGFFLLKSSGRSSFELSIWPTFVCLDVVGNTSLVN